MHRNRSYLHQELRTLRDQHDCCHCVIEKETPQILQVQQLLKNKSSQSREGWSLDNLLRIVVVSPSWPPLPPPAQFLIACFIPNAGWKGIRSKVMLLLRC